MKASKATNGEYLAAPPSLTRDGRRTEPRAVSIRHSIRSDCKADALPDIMTAKELEAFLRIDVKTIYRYVQLGRIPYLRMESNVRFSKQEVLRWLEERSFRPRPVRTARANGLT